MSDLINAGSFFYIYSFIGWCVEVIYHGVIKNRFVNRGFLNGPVCPVYGVGFYGVVLLLTPYIDNFALLFFGSMLITSLIELFAGFILYKIFNLRWWDYTGNKFNIGGFVCLRFSVYWGLAGTFAMLVIHPPVEAFVINMPNIVKVVLLAFFSVVLVIDFIATVLAVLKIKKRILLISEASEELRVMSDRIGGKIFDHVEPVVKKSAPVIEGYGEIKELYNKNRAEEKRLYQEHRAQEKALYDKLMAKEKAEFDKDRQRLVDRINDAINSINSHEHYVLRRITDNEGQHNIIRRLIQRELFDSDKIDEESEE